MCIVLRQSSFKCQLLGCCAHKIWQALQVIFGVQDHTVSRLIRQYILRKLREASGQAFCVFCENLSLVCMKFCARAHKVQVVTL